MKRSFTEIIILGIICLVALNSCTPKRLSLDYDTGEQIGSRLIALYQEAVEILQPAVLHQRPINNQQARRLSAIRTEAEILFRQIEQAVVVDSSGERLRLRLAAMLLEVLP